MDDPEPLEGLSGQWIIVAGDVVLAHDHDLSVILRKAGDYPDDEISVRKVLSGQACFY
jgi:hypothetical protein